MKLLLFGFIAILCLFSADAASKSASKDPIIGHWNVTRGIHGDVCIKLTAGIRLDINYINKDDATKTATIVADENVTVIESDSSCGKVGSLLDDQRLVLDFHDDRKLKLFFTRDHNVTGDAKEGKWELYKIEFDYSLNNETFPDAKYPDKHEERSNSEPKSFVAATNGTSYGCTKPEPMKVTDNFTITFNHFRVEAFITNDDFGKVLQCQNEQTSDLITIIIGAALAALVIIVLIAYLIGRARARTTTYDNI